MSKPKRKVMQLDYYTGEKVEVYNSLKEAAEDNFILPGTLCDALREQGGIMKIKKLMFKYMN